MHCIHSLPGGYRECLRIDLQKDRKAALLVNGAALLLTLLLLWGGNQLVPLRGTFAADGPGLRVLRIAVIVLGIVAYTVLHELTHAAVMKLCGAGKLRFGFTGAYAFAGSEGDYFNRRAYRLIALAPLVVWALLLSLTLAAVPRSWFWVIWFIQTMNLSGSAGDVYVTLRLLPLSDTVWIRDTGVELSVYDHVRVNIKKDT